MPTASGHDRRERPAFSAGRFVFFYNGTMNTTHRVLPLVVLGVSLLAGCLPSHLKKYQKEGTAKAERTERADPLQPQASDTLTPTATVAEKSQAANRTDPSGAPAPARATIYAVDKQTYRFALKDTDVWDSALNVLMRNYNLTIVDRQSGIITTEWDGYYLGNAVYRNKVSLRIFRSAWNSIDVSIHNNVERLRDASQAAGTVGAVWLPAEDPASEVARIIQNMALVLNQPPPVLPPNVATAKGGTPTQTTNH